MALWLEFIPSNRNADSEIYRLPEGVEKVMPGDNIKMLVILINPIAMIYGLCFAITEGGHTVSDFSKLSTPAS